MIAMSDADRLAEVLGGSASPSTVTEGGTDGVSKTAWLGRRRLSAARPEQAGAVYGQPSAGALMPIETHYEAWVKPPKWDIPGQTLSLFVSSFLATLVWLISDDSVGMLVVNIFFWVMCLACWVFYLARCRITVDDDTLVLEVVPWFFRRRLPLTDILSVELTPTDPRQELGMAGCGYTRKGEDLVGYIFTGGPAARVATRDGCTYVISAPDADRLVAVLRERAHLDSGGETAEDAA